jgi:hypothetical protein
MERDEEIRAAINEAAAAPASDAVVIELKPNQKLLTLRAAVTRILREEPRDINFGVRGGRLVFSKGSIPGGRGAGARSGRKPRRRAAASA